MGLTVNIPGSVGQPLGLKRHVQRGCKIYYLFKSLSHSQRYPEERKKDLDNSQDKKETHKKAIGVSRRERINNQWVWIWKRRDNMKFYLSLSGTTSIYSGELTLVRFSSFARF